MQAEAAPQYGLTQEQQQQEYSDISASTSAAVAADGRQISDQISAQIATAAGGSANAGDAPLTNNEELTLPEVVVTAAPIRPGDDTALDIYANLVQRSPTTGEPTYAQRPAVDQLGNMASLHYDLSQAGLIPSTEENQTIAEQAALASGSAAYGSLAFAELQQQSASQEAAIQARSYGSVIGLWNQEISGFKGTVRDQLAYQGNQYLENGNTLGFVGTGLESSFFDTFMPGSVGGAALMLGGGEVAGPALGEFSRYAADVVPLLGRDVTDLAGAAWNRLSNLNPFAGSASRIGSAPLSPQLGQLNLSAFVPESASEVSPAGALSIGNSGYASYQAFSGAAFQTYQQAVDEGFAAGQQALQEGGLPIPEGVSENTVLGQFVDRYARGAMKDWLESEGIDASSTNLININQQLINPDFSGTYRIPDVFIPKAMQIYDATIGFKSWDTPQIQDFFNFSGGSNITIVRPTQLGGSYSIVVPPPGQ